MKKQDFVSALIKHGQGFAMTVLAITGAIVLIGLFIIVFVVAAFFNRIMH